MRKPQRVKSKTKIAMLKPQLIKNERRLSQHILKEGLVAFEKSTIKFLLMFHSILNCRFYQFIIIVLILFSCNELTAFILLRKRTALAVCANFTDSEIECCLPQERNEHLPLGRLGGMLG